MRTHVLVVEDSRTQAEALSAHLEAAEYEVSVAPNGEEGLAAVERASFDLIVSDVVMPGMDGYELCRLIKQASPNTPVLLLTSLSDPMDIIRGLEAGADNFLTKPYDPEHLLERLQALLKTQRARAQERVSVGVKIYFLGKEFTISSDREQILDLLVTTFEEAVQQNWALRKREEELTLAKTELARYARTLEAQLERVLNSVPDVVFSVSPDWKKVHYMSQAARDVFGCEPDSFSFDYWKSRIAPEDRDRAVNEVTTDAGHGSRRTLEYRFASNSGPQHWIAQTVIPVLQDDHVTRVDGIARDVTDRRMVESRLRRMVDSGIVGVIFWDLDGNILQANDEFLRIVGYSREDLISGRVRWKDMAPPEWASRNAEAIAEMAATGKCTPFRQEYIRKDGSRVPIVFGAAAFDATPDQGVAFIHDLTQQAQTEAELRGSEERVRLLLESTAEGIYGLDLEGNCTFCNPAAAQLLGYDNPAALFGRNMHELIHHSHADGSAYAVEECPIYRVFREGTNAHIVDEVLWRADGTAFPAEYWSHPIRRDGEVAGAVVTFLDITERKALEEQVRQSQKLEAVGQLAGGVAHDFNNLLTVISGETEMLLCTPLDEVVVEGLEEVRSAARRAASLTNQLLVFSRREVSQPAVFNPNELVADLEKMLSRLIGENVDLTARPAPDLGAVLADRGQIEQVLTNLVVNGRDAMPDGGAIVIETRNVTLGEHSTQSHPGVAPGPYVMLAVSDTGTGMTPEVQQRLFEPFFTTKEQAKGTGLGLATCYGIVKQCGGHIDVHSEVGVGTTMKVYLPMVSSEAAAPTASPATTAATGTETVLVIEDDEAVRQMTTRILEAQGYRVTAGGNGEEALRLLDQADEPIQLLLTDVVLPGKSGRQIAADVQAQQPEIKVLFMSGYTEDVILRTKLLEHDIALIQKPFTPAALAGKVREVLDG